MEKVCCSNACQAYLVLRCSPADGNHKMNFAGFFESMAKLEVACLPIDHDGDRRAQAIPIAQALFHPGIQPVQVIDHLPNGLAIHRNDPLAVRKMP